MCVNETDSTDEKKQTGDYSRSADYENGDYFGTKAEAAPRVKEAGDEKKKSSTKEGVSEFWLVFVRTALQLVTRRERKEVRSIIRLGSDAIFGADELRRHVKGIHGCKRTLDDSRDKELAEGSFTK